MGNIKRFEINNINSDFKINSNMLDKSIIDLITSAGGGSISNFPDEEDLTSKITEAGLSSLHIKDRDFGDGMGYVILRKNKTLSEQLTKPNTVYEIRYNFILDQNISIPNNCVLDFKGGSISSQENIDIISGDFIINSDFKRIW